MKNNYREQELLKKYKRGILNTSECKELLSIIKGKMSKAKEIGDDNTIFVLGLMSMSIGFMLKEQR